MDLRFVGELVCFYDFRNLVFKILGKKRLGGGERCKIRLVKC